MCSACVREKKNSVNNACGNEERERRGEGEKYEWSWKIAELFE